MGCPRHKSFKGITGKHKTCNDCNEILISVNNITKKGGKYRHLYNLDKKCSVVSLMAELCTYLLFGKQDARFLARGSKDTPAKAFYYKTKKSLSYWSAQDPDKFGLIDTLLHKSYYVYYRASLMDIPTVEIKEQQTRSVAVSKKSLSFTPKKNKERSIRQKYGKKS